MLELDSLSRSFGDLTALDRVSFTVAPGELCGFLGPNGAGKTTTMRIVMGLLAPTSGEARWDGRRIAPDDHARFGYIPEQRGLYPRMRVRDQLVYLARLHGFTKAEALRAADDGLRRLGLVDRGGERLEQLSHGNQQRVQLAAALVHDPVLLVLDEPFSGLDPIGVAALSEVLRERARAGCAVMFSSHQLDLVEDLCETVAMVDHGRLVMAGRLAELKAAAGRRLVVEVAGTDHDGVWVDALPPGVRVVGHDGARVRLDLDGVDAQTVLHAAEAAGAVQHFAFETPNLSELFLKAAGLR